MLSDKQLKSLISLEDQGQCLDMSHQELKKFKQIDLRMIRISKIDASYNYLKDFEGLNVIRSQAPPSAQNNKQSEMFKQDQEINLQWIDLSFNFLTNIDRIERGAQHFLSLKYLNLIANRIQSVDFSNNLFPCLESLHLKNNRLKFFVHCPSTIKVLTIDYNQLASLAFTGGDNLSILSVSHNAITKIGVVLPNILFLDGESNQIEDLQMVIKFLNENKTILSLNLLDNPVVKNKNYKISVLESCDRIVQINDVMISPHIRQGFKILKAQDQLDEIIQKTQMQYQKRIKDKIKIKQELLLKLQQQEKQVQHQFQSNLQEERQQLELLQKHAKNILGKNKLNVIKQKDQFQSIAGKYVGLGDSQISQSHIKQNDRQKYQSQHRNQYLDYLNKLKMKQQKQKTEIKRRQQNDNNNQLNTPNRKRMSAEANKKRKQLKTKQSIPKELTTKIDQNIELFDVRCIPILYSYYEIEEGEEG